MEHIVFPIPGLIFWCSHFYYMKNHKFSIIELMKLKFVSEIWVFWLSMEAGA